MKIVFLLSSLSSGGAERTVSYLSSYLAKKGDDVTILLFENEVFYTLHPDVKVESLDIKGTYKTIFGKYTNIAKRFIKTNNYLKKAKPDVVFCMLPYFAKYILNSHKKYGYKLITSERINPESSSESTRNLKISIFKESDGVIFQTIRAKEFYLDYIGDKGVVIHNAVGNDRVYSIEPAKERKEKISAMGRLAPQKDYPTLIKAFRSVCEKYPQYTLEIFGKGPDKDKLISLCETLGIKDKVIFKGSCEDAIERIADSKVYVMSSLFEGMPNALMEAMAVGLPCVSTDCPNGPKELITDGENGLLVPLSDVEKMTEAILKFIEDEELSLKCSQGAREILKTHHIDVKAKEFADYIESVYNE